ncbi:MAG TPA: hypothetical protein VKC61_19705 [Pyrinomonadaceae bacterium]|nr:hypothetical protein [Pyrinomonadaceae bacterium]
MTLKIPDEAKAWQVVLAISELHAAQLKTMNFISYRPIGHIRDRLESAATEIRAVFQEASLIREAEIDRRHFFDIALSLAIPRGLGEQVIKEMLKEPDPGTRSQIPIDIDDGCLRNRLETHSDVNPREDVFAVASKCTLRDGSEAHIPMMDFGLKSPEGRETVVATMRGISPGGGTVLQTENSYHFYGTELLDSKGWLEFLGKSLLFQGVIDDRYIGHRLREGFSVLRLTRGPSHVELPFVVAKW